jgi:hypothetical protein
MLHMSRLRSGCKGSWAVGVVLMMVSCQGDPGGPNATQTENPGLQGEPPSIPVGPVMPPGSTELNCDRTVPGRAEARLLTRLQYDNTVRDLLGVSATPAQSFPAENILLGFGNNADAHRASLLLAEGHLAAAEGVAAEAVATGLDSLLPCEAGDRSEACATHFITEFGYRAYRRPLTAEESEPLVGLFQQANLLWGFDKAIELLIQAFLQSPQLLYRPESLATVSMADAPAPAGAGMERPVALDSYQIASRLSYFLWNTMPDAELFSLADAGQLEDLATLRAQAERMLDDERARTTVRDFYEQWLGMPQLAGLTREHPEAPSPSAYNASWGASLEQFVQHTFWEESGNVQALLSSPSVFLDATLGELYGAPEGRYEDPNRAGILTQPGLMALLAHADQSAPVQRGKFVREQLLCQPLPPPPPDVDTTPPDPDLNATTRERFRQHSADPRCGGCHRLLDRVGFGLEGFDHLGRVRTEENGLPLDTSGYVEDGGDPNLEGEFNGALELAGKLAVSPQVEACLATQWFRYGMGRAEQRSDLCSLERVKTEFSAAGGDFRELLISLATTDAFRFRPIAEQDF